MMNSTAQTVNVELPAPIYAELAALASERQSDPAQMIAAWVRSLRQRQAWQQGWAELRRQVQAQPPQQMVDAMGDDAITEAIVEQMRHTRQELFDAEYAHLYR